MYYHLLALISGAVSTLQAGINTKLQFYLGNPILTSLVNFSVGTLCLSVIYITGALSGFLPVPQLSIVAQTKPWMWTAGILGTFFVFVTVVCSSKIGFANSFSLIVAGQILVSVLLDHYGLLGAPLHVLTPLRGIGIILLILSVYIIQNN